MGGSTGWRARLRALFARDDVRAEHAEELQFHLEMRAAELERGGLAPDQARRKARLAFGNPESLREASTDAFAFARLEDWARDLRLAGRRLRRAPAFAAVALATLALGIGANTALFAAIDAVLLRPLPWDQAEALVQVDEVRRATGESMAVAPANLRDWHVPAFEGVAAWAAQRMELAGAGEPETLSGQVVGQGYFELLRVRPALGRTFVAADFDPTAPPVALVSDGLWRRRFGADPGLLGRQLQLGGLMHEVVGILPPGVRTPGDLREARPFDVHVPVRLPREMLERRSEHLVRAFARLDRDATLDQARAQLTAVSERLAAQFPENREVRASARPLREMVVGSARGSLLLLQAATAAVLLIGCANLAGLMVVRGLARARELAVRSALGARRAVLVRESLAEALLLAAGGAGAGGALAPALLSFLQATAPVGTPLLAFATIDWRSVAAAAALGTACALVTGLLPALRVLRHPAADVLRADARTVPGGAWGARMVAAQAALALALGSGGVLLVRSLAALEAVPLGYDADRVLCLSLDLPPSRYPDAARRLAFFEQLQERVAALPGVEAVGFANRFPLRGGWGTGIHVDGMPEVSHPLEADAQAVSPSYFGTLGIPVLLGRGFESGDSTSSEPVAVVNEAFVRQHLAGRDPLGRRVRRHSGAPWTRVVGVVRDLRRDGPAEAATPQVYYAAAQTQLYPVRLADLAVRSAEGQALLAAIQREVWAIDPQQPLDRIATLAAALDRDLAPRRFAARGLAGLALVALGLALLGVYGTTAHTVSRRIPELGVRLALGAVPARLAAAVLGQSARQVAAGIGLGLPLALLLGRSLESQLVGVTPLDPASIAAAAALLLSGGALAAWPTARRAARVDPSAALRVE